MNGDKLAIAIVLDDFFPSSGGIGRSVQTQLEELTALGHDVTLIAPDRHLEKPRWVPVIECPTVYLEGTPAHLSVLHCNEYRAKLISQRGRWDIVHSQTDRGALVLSARIARLQGVPHVHTFHANIAGTHDTLPVASLFGTLSYELLITRVLKAAAKRSSGSRARMPGRTDELSHLTARMDWRSFSRIASLVDAFTVPSQFMYDLIREATDGELTGYVVPTGYNRGIREAIARTKRERDDGKVRFLSIGRLAKEKRLDVLIKAFRSAAIPDSELVLVGDGDQRDVLRRLAGDAPNIDFRWHLRSLDAIAYELVNADALVLSSYRFDSQGLVISEAVAAGLPVIYCDDRLSTGLTPESSLLTTPDTEGLADGMRLFADPQRRARYAANTSKLIDQVSPEATVRRYLEVYRNTIRGRHPHA
ncbi:MAG: glycosyltransferase [Propionibacteriaceae bacterium]|nr:glycosyltransferase [Propionibacteriaceae bacterium]